MIWYGSKACRRPTTGAASPPTSMDRLVQALRRDVVQQCVALPEARRTAEEAVRAAGFDLADAKTAAIEDPAARCTRAYAPLGGLVEIVLRGPS